MAETCNCPLADVKGFVENTWQNVLQANYTKFSHPSVIQKTLSITHEQTNESKQIYMEGRIQIKSPHSRHSQVHTIQPPEIQGENDKIFTPYTSHKTSIIQRGCLRDQSNAIIKKIINDLSPNNVTTARLIL